MNEFDYKAVAAKMREQTPPPGVTDPLPDYYSRAAIWAVITAMESIDARTES